MAQKLWEKNVQVNAEIDRFTVGRDREMDMYLAKYDVLGSMAHITMLESIGLLTSDELKILLEELKNIYASVERGEFVIEDGIEDVHSQVELMLTRRLGDVGKKIHSGRSRNDQVLVDLKLFIRAQLKSVAKCGTSYKKIATVHRKTFTNKKLKKGTYYKYMVVALNEKGKVVAISKLIHVATKGGKVGNCKKLKVNKSKVNLKQGRKFKLKVKQIAKSKKVKLKKHRKTAFESDNQDVAVVSKKGVITAKKKGKCSVYVYAQNGVYKQVKVTVK